jgi:hypothetical protein
MLVQATVETPNPITVGCSSCATQPSVIDLIGVLIPLSGPPITGRALDDPGVITVLPPLGVNLQYRANGCVIGKPTVCGPVINIPIIPIVNELPPPDTLTNLLTLVPSPPLLEVGDFEGPADVTIIGSGNEEIWRKPDSRP